MSKPPNPGIPPGLFYARLTPRHAHRRRGIGSRIHAEPFLLHGVLHLCCGKCGSPKPTTEFPPQANSPSGLNSWCRACHVEHARIKAKTKKGSNP